MSFLALAPALVADIVKDPPPQPRRPRGIYADVNVDEQIKVNKWTDPTKLEADFKALYKDLFNNPAVSGIVLYEDWAALNPNPPTPSTSSSESPIVNQEPEAMARKVGPAPLDPYDWSLIDDLFAAAKAWNSKNPTKAQKTVQLVVTPGINSPSWVKSLLTSCDYMFQPPSSEPPPSSCGMVTFWGFVEGGHPGGTDIAQTLPMPWDPTYKSAWQTFLTALAAKYESNPLFVSIALAGPTASSEEMMFPNDNDTTNPQTQFKTPISPNDMWLALLKSQYAAAPSNQYPGLTYQNSDQGFIDEWENAINMYAKIFSGITLSISTGRSFPELCTATAENPCTFPIAAGFSSVCPKADMDCAAETAIEAYFEEPTSGGNNAKAVQEDGLKATTVVSGGTLGLAGIKVVSQSTQFDPAPSEQIVGGSQFSTSFAQHTDNEEGCTSCGDTPEQVAYNVLGVYFGGTPVATFFGGGMMGTAPLNYLQIYAPDFQYAETHTATTATTLGPKSAQDLLNLASEKLMEIAEPTLP